MIRRSICWTLLPLLLCYAVARAEPPIYAKLVVPVLFDDELPRDMALVNEAVNEITRGKIGAEVTLVPLLYAATSANQDQRKLAELAMLQKQGIFFDVLPDLLPDANLIALNELLPQYGQDILRAVTPERLTLSAANGAITELPSVSDYVASAGITMRRDIVEKYSLDLSQIRSIRDLDALFAFVHSVEPTMKVTCGYRTGGSLIYRYNQLDVLPDTVCDVSPDDPRTIVNQYATDEYAAAVALIRKWAELGYLPSVMALQNMTSSQLVQAGELFSYFSACKPGIEYEESVNCGMDMVTIPLIEPIITRRSLSLSGWGISKTCTNPGKAMMFLNLLYSDSELANLLIYGIEGLHYDVRPNGTIAFPQGVTQRTAGYLNKQPWLLPNQLITHVWGDNDPLLWEKTRAYNESAATQIALDFRPDDSSVRDINRRLNAIASRYTYGLETGQLDPDIYLPQMLKEMKEAGVDRVMEEIQSQYDAWLRAEEP